MRYWYCECPVCGFSCVLEGDDKPDPQCTLCLVDSRHEQHMSVRAAFDDDKVEGFDARDGR